ncbi:MAG: hypothetical protein II306_03545 [Clostridia bacterium]|nr:hypothetical protein [Clostridia bacterium]
MKFEKSLLIKKIKTLKPFMGKQSEILVHAGKMYATDMVLQCVTPIDHDEEFVLPKKAIQLIETLPNGVIDISTKDGKVIVKSGRSISRFTTSSVENFPLINVETAEAITTIPCDEFSALVSSVLHAAQDNPQRPVHGGVSFEGDGEYLNIAACDGSRVAWQKVKFIDKVNIIVPKFALQKLLPLCTDGDVTIQSGENKAVFTVGDYEVTAPLLFGEFFNYKPLFKDIEGCIVETSTLCDILQRANVISNLGNSKFTFSPEEIEISANEAIADFSETMPCKNGIEDLTMGFNPRLMLESAKTFESATVKFAVSGATQPAIISSGDHKVLLMPVRLN